jgi:hypothetical protein
VREKITGYNSWSVSYTKKENSWYQIKKAGMVCIKSSMGLIITSAVLLRAAKFPTEHKNQRNQC